jgi:hypothetical protein
MENSMVPALPTIEEITGYLNSANLTANHVCGDDTVCATLSNFTSASEVMTQLSQDLGGARRAWWIEYVNESNKFVLHCSFFDSNMEPITHSQFVTQLTAAHEEEVVSQNPAVLYTGGSIIEWTSTEENVWSISYEVSSAVSDRFVNDGLNVIKKVG